MKKYSTPNAELVEFGNDKLNTFSSDTCNCYAEHWNYEEDYNFEKCTLTTGDYSEVADANGGL